MPTATFWDRLGYALMVLAPFLGLGFCCFLADRP